MKTKSYLLLIPAAGLLILAACQTKPQMQNRPDFLTTYTHLQKVDDTTYRYVSAPLLANCKKFIVSPVHVLFTQVDGKPVTAEERQRAADFVRQTIVSTISGHYPVVSEPGPDVAEIRIAITEGYRTGGKVGLCIQGEILDNSGTQVAAVVRTELSEVFAARWENKPTARAMVEVWAQRLLKILDEAHRR